MLRRSALFAGLVALGCNQQSPPPAPNVAVAAAQPEAAPEPVAPAVQPKVEPPAPPAPPPVFPFPADAAGQALPKIVTPAPPPPPATERFAAAPLTRTPPARVIDPAPLAKTRYAPPPLLPAKAVGLKPAAPAERVPLDFGFAATAVPAKPALPNPPGITEKARDVNLPPELPPLGRPVPDRASLDDPTAEPANAAIITRSPTLVLGQAGFLKVTLPDPFELAEQVKPKVPPTADPGLAPVVVNPQRPK